MITRRTMLGGMAGGALAGAITRGQAQGAGRPVTIAIGGYTFAYLPLLVATAAGFMKDAGLDVSLIDTGSGTNSMAAILGGSVDVAGLVMSDVILAVAKGQKINAFAPLMSQYASDAVISRKTAEKIGLAPEMPLKERMARMKGLTLAISGRGSGTDKIWRYLLSLGGLDPEKDVSLTVVKLDKMYLALRSGQIDGFNTTAPANNQAVEDGLAVWAARPSHGEVPGIENFLYTVLCGRPDFLDKNPEVAASLVRGMTRASELIRNDPAAAGQLLHDKYFQQTNVELIKHTVSDQRMTVSVPPTLSEQQFAHNIEFELKFSDAVRGVTYQQAINPRWLGT
ncbi:ABC transporter substrate-binding protein [Bradyrhizobium sp. CCBAU 45389]|uniref:ABC transporter substrate-binding protein n=1 Tax=Bradyrhizobium sp. CCBAU 45389 TaxID=858429 RepID=UPI002306A6C3|nr:ABC transporter substrate-binding protein [Bradyrhizobium sp. CCBAU 45389]